MRTRSAAQRAAAAAPWAELPLALWEQIAALLPTADVMSLRQAWRGAAQLAGARVRSEASARLKKELASCVLTVRGAAVITAMEGVAIMLQNEGGVCLDFLYGWMNAASRHLFERFNYRAISSSHFLGQRPGVRASYAFEPPHTRLRMQVRLPGPTVAVPARFLACTLTLLSECTHDHIQTRLGLKHTPPPPRPAGCVGPYTARLSRRRHCHGRHFPLLFLTLDDTLVPEVGLAFGLEYPCNVSPLPTGGGIGPWRAPCPRSGRCGRRFWGVGPVSGVSPRSATAR